MPGGSPPDTDADQDTDHDTNLPELKETITWLSGLSIAVGYGYLALLSLQSDFTLDPSVSITVFAFSMALLFGIGPLTDLADALRK